MKRLKRQPGSGFLDSDDPDYPDTVVHEKLEEVIWGVVTAVIHAV